MTATIKVFCLDCASEEATTDRHDEIYLENAWDPTRMPHDGDLAILAAPTLRDVNPVKLLRARAMKCEECGKTVYVAPSSQWLLDLKAKQ